MLILTRHVGQKIMVGDNIVVQVVRIGREKVRIGVTAPPAIPIRLGEEKQVTAVSEQKHLFGLKTTRHVCA
jgi:carbon storage regulator